MLSFGTSSANTGVPDYVIQRCYSVRMSNSEHQTGQVECGAPKPAKRAQQVSSRHVWETAKCQGQNVSHAPDSMQMSVKLQPGLGKTQPPPKKIPDGAGSKLDEVRLRACSQSPIDTKVIFTSKTLYLWRHVLKCSLFWMRFNAFSLQEYMCSPTPCSTSILLQPQAALVTKGQQIKEQNINQGLRGLVISGTASLHVSLLKSFNLSCRSFLLGWNVPVATRTSAEVPILCI